MSASSESGRSESHAAGRFHTLDSLLNHDLQLRSEADVDMWRRIFLGRLVVIAVLAVIPLVDQFLPENVTGFEGGYQITLILLGAVLPLDLLYRRSVVRHRALPEFAPFTDQVTIVAILAISPEFVEQGLVLMVAVSAIWTAAFNLRISASAGAVGLTGLTSIMALSDAPITGARIFFFALAGSLVAWVVDTIVRRERSVALDLFHFVDGVGAVLWRQEDPDVHAIRTDGRGATALGMPIESWSDEGFFGRRLSADDQRLREAALTEADAQGWADVEYEVDLGERKAVFLERLYTERTDGRIVGRRGLLMDVTQQRRAAVRASRLDRVIDHVPSAILTVEAEGSLRVIAANPAAADLAGVRLEEMTGTPVPGLIALAEPEAVRAAVSEVARTGETLVVEEYRPRLTDDDNRAFSVQIFALPDGAVGIVAEDATARVDAEEELRRFAAVDPLTGLGSRNRLLRDLSDASALVERAGGTIALTLIDLNNFREVNDAVGHEQGDKLLVNAAERLSALTDPTSTLYRVDGDSFAQLIVADDGLDQAQAFALRATAAFSSPFRSRGLRLPMRASAGVAGYDPASGRPARLLREAETAVHQAKMRSEAVRVFDPSDDPSSVERVTLAAELGEAIEADQLVLFFQPVLELGNNRVARAEALVRWDHPERGLLLPGQFLELAETTGLIETLTRWVVLEAVLHARSWIDHGIEVAIAVNLSARDLQRDDLVDGLIGLLDRHEVPAGRLAVELTESSLIEDPERAVACLTSFGAAGIRRAIDDFGTGYASLSYLSQLPVDEVKLDRYFVANLGKTRPIIDGTLTMCRELGLDVLAEGVETAEELSYLRDIRCDYAQGYHIARPMPAAAFVTWYRDRKTLEAGP